MRQEILNWSRKNGNTWKPFLDLFKTAPVTDKEFYFILEEEHKNKLKNLIRHSKSHYNPVRECLNSIHNKDKAIRKDLIKIDSDFLNNEKINLKKFLLRIQKYPMRLKTFNEGTSANIVNQSKQIVDIANELHRQDKYKKQEEPSLNAKKIQSDLEEDIINSKKIVKIQD